MEYRKRCETCYYYEDIYCHYEFDTAIAQGKTCPNIRSVDLVSWYILQDDKIIEKYLIEDDFIQRFQNR